MTEKFSHTGAFRLDKDAYEYGQFVVTTNQVKFVPNDSKDVHRYSWATISSYKIATEQLMILLILTAGEKKAYKLTGSDTNKVKMEFERMRVVFRECSTASSSLSVGNNSNDSGGIIKKRQQLLEADKGLSRMYKDLVVVNRILDEEEFWNSKSNLFDDVADTGSNTAKGKVSDLISDTSFKDLLIKTKDGSALQLHKDVKDEIFLMYPAVAKAFETKDINLSEEEFWIQYFNSEYYNRDKGQLLSKERNKGGGDDIFSRLEDPRASAHPLLTSISAKTNLTTHSSLSGIVVPDVDLTSNYGDHRVVETDRGLEGIETSKHSKDVINSSLAVSIAAKYNKKSNIVIKDSISVNDRMSMFLDSNELKELNVEENIKHVPLNLNKKPNEAVEVEDEGSVFKKARTITYKSERSKTAQISAKEYMSSMSSVFPTSESALSFIKDDIKNKQSFTAAAKFAANNSSIIVNFNWRDNKVDSTVLGTMHDALGGKKQASRWQKTEFIEGMELPSSFKEEFNEKFSQLTEYLRFLYDTLNKPQIAAPGTSGGNKCAALANKLNDIAEVLEKKKIYYLENGDLNNKITVTCIVVIDEQLKIIRKGLKRWEDYKCLILK